MRRLQALDEIYGAMADHLQCGVCFEPYTAGSRLPKFLQCGGGIQHTYCLQCLRHLTVGGMIKCPCCGDLTSVSGRSADALKNNIYLLPQIEAAAAAAQTKNGLEMFCKSCGRVATDKCGEHELLKLSELRDLLREMAEQGAQNTETIKQKRSVPLELFKDSHSVLMSVAESVRRNMEDWDMDVQLDDNIVGELERKREAIETLPKDQLADEYGFIDQHLSDAIATLKDSSALADQCKALVKSNVAISVAQNGMHFTFPVGDWLHSGDLMKALLAASIVIYLLDHATSDGPDDAVADEKAGACNKANGVAEPNGVVNHSNASGVKPSKVSKSADNGKSSSKSTGKTTPTSNDKASTQSTNSAAGKATTKYSGTSIGKPATSSTAKKTATADDSDSGKSGKTTSASKKTTSSEPPKLASTLAGKGATATGNVSATSAGTAAAINAVSFAKAVAQAVSQANGKPAAAPAAKASGAVAKSKSPPSFSTMLKSAAAEPAVPRAAAVPRAPRGVHPLYSLRVTNGASTTDVIIELRPDMAPIMCKNFVMLCDGGFYDNTKFHFAAAGDYLLGGKVDNDEGFSPLAQPPEKFVQADQCPLQDECGAIRMKGVVTVVGPNGEKRGLIGSQFMIWASESREYRKYQYTLVFGFIRQGLDFIRSITNMDRPSISRHARLLSTKPYQK